MMAKFSGDTRFCILTENSPAEAANELNSLLFAAGIEEKFITLSLSVLDPERRTLTLTSAGHLPVLIRHSNGSIDEIGEEIAGFPLGIVPEGEYKQTQVVLQPGDVVAVFSDGVTDARNLREELYDSRDKRRLLRKLADTSGGPETIGRALLQDIREFSAGHNQVDDITLICFGPVAR
jgi:serine phosphatase RsbU (regulator of sigma subunit)